MLLRRSTWRALPVALVSLWLASCISAPVKSGQPVVVADHARFSFLTPTLVRMEYSPGGAFVDAPTAVMKKRDWAPVTVHVSRENGWLVAGTDAMTLRYRLNSGPFNATNLKVSWNETRPAGKPGEWNPGADDPQNLGGLTYSLDNISKANLTGNPLESPVNNVIPGIEVKLEQARPGLLSRSGYAFVDDSGTPLWNAGTQWIEPRKERNEQDWYLFAYGGDYRKALGEYAQLSGAIPMIPRYVLGPWITDFNFEYFPGTAEARQPAFQRYNQKMLEDQVTRLRNARIPFDTLVLDFAWHNYGWDGGYDWSPLIPQPDRFITWLHGRGVKLGLNDHPGYANTQESILSFDDSHAPAVLQDLGKPPLVRPSFDLDLSSRWRFAIDPRDVGVNAKWYAAAFDARNWKAIQADRSWQVQGQPNYAGVAWYRADVRLPADLPKTLYLVLGEVDKSYRVFVNGQELQHSQVQWPQRLTYTDIAAVARPGDLLHIALRVEPGRGGGGLLRGPVALRDVHPPERIAFDLSNQREAEIFMRRLHEPLMRQGVDLWWVDGGGGATGMPGLNPQFWTNKVFYDFSAQATGKRAFILGRYGDWGSQRYPGFFTGDTYSEWPVLAYEVAFTARGGNVLVPYISHDIGGFHGAKLDFDLYARWIQFGTFSPLLRMHSAHANPREGNTRMPWLYGEKGMALMRKYFTLRTQLIPYIYSYAWVAHRDSLPLLRPLYLQQPELEEAYKQPYEYFFGDDLLVAPVLEASGQRTVYLPPGQWVDFFKGKRYQGDSTFTARYAVDDMPVFARAGAIVPMQPPSDYSDAKPLDTLILHVFGDGDGSFSLYEDDGISLDYDQGGHAITAMHHTTGQDGGNELTIDAAQGEFKGQVQRRAYELRVHMAKKPSALSVNGKPGPAWRWNAKEGVATATVPTRSVHEAVHLSWH
jgi:alpha-glucosidase (family GH31 glycosyl hydrolase)